jgi:hypothetical protein
MGPYSRYNSTIIFIIVVIVINNLETIMYVNMKLNPAIAGQPLQQVAYILGAWEQLSKLPQGHVRNVAYWGCVESILEAAPETLAVMAASHSSPWTAVGIARRLVEKRAKW